MFSAKHFIIYVFLALAINNIAAQNITGTWEGRLNKDRFLQLNIVQNGDRICGYTWDYLLNNPESFCKTYFEGCYSHTLKIWGINAVSFIDKSDSNHTLMSLQFHYKMAGKSEILKYSPGPGLKVLSILLPEETINAIYLKKVSDKPVEIIEKMKDCMPYDRAKGSVSEYIKPDIEKIAAQLVKRKNIEQKRIEVNTKYINLKVYDNAVIDGDTVSILCDGKILTMHQLLTEKAIEFNIELDENLKQHEIILFAENLGSIPPNTALLIITAGDKRYELFASANLQENAVLILNYKPEK